MILRRRVIHLVTAFVVVIAGYILQLLYEPIAVPDSAPQSAATTSARVVRVVDGDTILLDTTMRVRYIGVNTPESVDPRKPVECFGKEASAYNSQLVEGKVVQLVADVQDTDAYGRLLRYVYLEDGTFVNVQLVQDGYASVMTVPPNVAHQTDFIQAERAARVAKRGLWSACK